MNTNNLEFLKTSLKYLGFSDKLNADLENKIKEQPSDFKLDFKGVFNKDKGTDEVKYSLDFKKSDQSDMYFLNRYNATLQNENDPSNNRSQTFFINKSAGITAKEAYNLLSGRAVNKNLLNKEGEPFNAWLQLDFKEKDTHGNHLVKQYHQGYGYDLNQTVAKYPIKELENDQDRTKLTDSLNKGNIQQVTFVKDGNHEKMFVEANPQFKTLNLYDSSMQKVFQGVDKKEKQPGDKTPDKKESVSKDAADDDGEKAQKASKGRKIRT